MSCCNSSLNNDDNGDLPRVDEVEDTGIPCLPPPGDSSYDDTIPLNIGGKSQAVGFVANTLQLQYTCKVCETRNTHKVSKLAYNNGVVIVTCKECKCKHLIADNLGWTKYVGGFDGDTNIENFLETMGRGDEVNRVSKEVFDLEKKFHNDGPETMLNQENNENNGQVFE